MVKEFDNLKMTKLYETTALRCAGLVAASLLFIVEFQFDTKIILHLIALSMFSLSVPLLTFVILAANLWMAGERFEKSNKRFHFGPIHHFGAILTICAIGLCLFSLHWVSGVAYTIGCLFVVNNLGDLLGASPKNKNISSKDDVKS